MVFSGRKGNDAQVKITPGTPSVETTISTDGSGLVTLHASADKAVKFTFFFGEGVDNPVSSADGSATHTYLSSGTYTPSVLAYSVDNIFVDKTVSITIQVNEPPIPQPDTQPPITTQA